MKKIEVKSWEEGGKQVNLLDAINLIVGNMPPQKLPKGFDKFKQFGRIGDAFQKARETNVLELEETDYDFLKECIQGFVPAQWALNPQIKNAIEAFMKPKGG